MRSPPIQLSPVLSLGGFVRREIFRLRPLAWLNEHGSVTEQEIHFVELDGAAMSALVEGDLAEAGRLAGACLTEYFLTNRARWLWRYRLGQIAADPHNARWMARQAILGDGGAVIGHTGFHGPPDESGMVEIGYSVDPAFRRRGYARAALVELLRRAVAAPRVRTVRATISPDNAGSLATLAGFGFVQVGKQWDTEDGLELVFEKPMPASGQA